MAGVGTTEEESWLSWLFSLLGTRKRVRDDPGNDDDASASERKRMKGEQSDENTHETGEGSAPESEKINKKGLLGFRKEEEFQEHETREGDPFEKCGKEKEFQEHSRLSILTDRSSIQFVQSSLTMLILRGLPGSGKSSLVGRIRKTYPQAEVCSADAYFTHADGSYQYDRDKIKEAHIFSQEKAEALCRDACNLVIVDNTHVKRWELQPYLNIATKFRYSVVILEPQTPWAKDPEQLAMRNSHNVKANVIRKKLKEWQEIRPRYFCWQLNLADSHLLLNQAKTILHLAAMSSPSLRDWLNEGVKKGEVGEEEVGVNEEHAQLTADGLSENIGSSIESDSVGSETGSEGIGSQIEFYSRECCSGSSKDLLHCTARFLRRGMEVDERTLSGQGRNYRLKLAGLTLTKATFGARVQLNEEQLELWHEEDIDASDRIPLAGVTSKSCIKVKDFSKQGDEVVSKSSGGQEDRNKRDGGKETPLEEVVDLEKHLLACRSSLVHRKKSPSPNQSSTSQSSSSSLQREQSPCPATNTAAENQLSSLTSLGSRAHLTLGCTEGVRPMQTGLDQLALLQGKVVEEIKVPGGVLVRIEDCGWMLNFDSDITVDALFTGVYV